MIEWTAHTKIAEALIEWNNSPETWDREPDGVVVVVPPGLYDQLQEEISAPDFADRGEISEEIEEARDAHFEDLMEGVMFALDPEMAEDTIKVLCMETASTILFHEEEDL